MPVLACSGADGGRTGCSGLAPPRNIRSQLFPPLSHLPTHTSAFVHSRLPSSSSPPFAKPTSACSSYQRRPHNPLSSDSFVVRLDHCFCPLKYPTACATGRPMSLRIAFSSSNCPLVETGRPQLPSSNLTGPPACQSSTAKSSTLLRVHITQPRSPNSLRPTPHPKVHQHTACGPF